MLGNVTSMQETPRCSSGISQCGSYPSTVLLHGYVRCQSYSSTLIPAFAHSIAYTGLSSINTLAPSSLQHVKCIEPNEASEPAAACWSNRFVTGGFITSEAAGGLLQSAGLLELQLGLHAALSEGHHDCYKLTRGCSWCPTCRSLTWALICPPMPSGYQNAPLERCQDNAALAIARLAAGSHTVLRLLPQGRCLLSSAADYARLLQALVRISLCNA